LLVFGPVVCSNGTTESLVAFIRKSAPRHGSKVSRDGGLSREAHGHMPLKFFVHEVVAPEADTVTDQVLENLTLHRDTLRRKIWPDAKWAPWYKILNPRNRF
jgi:hypothetical protein